jgi:hypothetical protein
MSPRKTNIMYTLTTDGVDSFSASTRISAASVRVSNPDARVTVVCDRTSARAMELRGDPLPNEVDQLVICDTPEGSGAFRNRFMKTKIRTLSDSALLYLDNDTFVQGDLSNLFALDVDIAAAANNSMDTFKEQRFSDDHRILTRLGWQTRSDVYVNSGVMFFNDTSGAWRISNVWHTKYLESVKETGAFRDQPSLNTALTEVASFAILPHRYNAQFRWRPDSVVDAVVLHFFSSGHFAPTRFDNLVSRLVRGEPLPLHSVESLVRDKSASYAEELGMTRHSSSQGIGRASVENSNTELQGIGRASVKESNTELQGIGRAPVEDSNTELQGIVRALTSH